MIRHHLPTFQQKKQIQFQIYEKKLVKTFIYDNQTQWIEYFTGFLFMEPNNDGKVDLKIRFSRYPHFAQIQAGVRYPLQLFTDNEGLYTLIHQQKIKTVQKPEQNLLYLKIGHEGRIIAISFHSKSYCKALLEHLTLVLQNNESDQMTWTEQNLKFLNASMKQNLIYVDSVFILEERITQFLGFFNKVDKKLYLKSQKNIDSIQEKYMIQFFQIVKNVFLRGNGRIIATFISSKYNFETVLKCLSYNPFGIYHFNYLQEFNKMTIIDNNVEEFQNDEFSNNYELITKIKFLKDVAICTFIQIPTQAEFNDLLQKSYIHILKTLGDSKNHLIEKLQQLSHKDQYKYICVFSQIWEIFKAVLEYCQTTTIKQMFYLKWIQNGMFSQTLSAFGRLLKMRQVSDIHPRFWQKFLQSMNPLLSYQWNESQKMILHHQNTLSQDQTMDLTSSLIMLLANCDSNTKIFVLDFVRVQIQISENRKAISAKYLSYLYANFVSKSYEYCNNEENIEKYIEFIRKIYVAQPIRTRHFMVENNVMSVIKRYVSNKFVFIMMLKLLKTFIQVDNNDTFRYLATTDYYDCFRQKYTQNQNLKNITNSIFLSIFKVTQNMDNKQGKKYLYKIFFAQDIQKGTQYVKYNQQVRQNQQVRIMLPQQSDGSNYKRQIPSYGFQNYMQIEK